MTKRRCSDSVVLTGDSRTERRPESALTRPSTVPPSRLVDRSAASALSRTVAAASRGLRSDSPSASATSVGWLGSGCGRHSSGIVSRGLGSTSRITWPRSTVETPSTRTWWDLERIAKRPCSSPSIR